MMESQKIYEMSKLMLEKSLKEPTIMGTPTKVYYEQITAPFSQFSLSMPCRIISIARYQYLSGFTMDGRDDDIYDLLYVFEGELTVQSRSGCKTVSHGEAILLRECTSFHVTQSDDPLDILILRTSGLLSSSYYEIITKEGVYPVCLKNKEVWDSLIENIIYYSSIPSNLNDVLAAHTMSRIYVEMYTNSLESMNGSGTPQRPQWLSETVDYMQEHYSENLTVAHLASRSNISESYFQKVFKEYISMPPYQYLTSIRINHAKSLLINTQLQVKLIARTVGYRSVNHFIQHFQRLTGMTPTVYRAQQRTSEGILR